MFSKLKRKFILMSMLLVTAILAVAIIAICAITYQRDYAIVADILAETVEQAMHEPNGDDEWTRFPFEPEFPQRSQGTDSADGIEALELLLELDGHVENKGNSNSNASEGASHPPVIGSSREARGDAVTPVAMYKVSDGCLVEVGDKATASLSAGTLLKLEGEVGELPDGTGELGDVRLLYSKQTNVHGTSYIAFADMSATSSWEKLATTLGLVAVAILLIVFSVLWVFSEWALRPVREAWDQQKRFVADVSHDLKTPITVILANMSILKKHPRKSVSEQMNWVDNTEEETGRMLALVNEMLELARVEEMPDTGNVEDVDLSEVVEGLSLSMDAMAMEKGVVSELDCEDGVVVSGDAQRIVGMLETIAENAFKYVDAGGTVEMSVSSKGKEAVVSIRNTGDPVAKEDLPHIFERFYRADKARTGGVGGFGLGLAIARETARSMGGDVRCKSSEKIGGTVFTVTLPLAKTLYNRSIGCCC